MDLEGKRTREIRHFIGGVLGYREVEDVRVKKGVVGGCPDDYKAIQGKGTWRVAQSVLAKFKCTANRGTYFNNFFKVYKQGNIKGMKLPPYLFLKLPLLCSLPPSLPPSSPVPQTLSSVLPPQYVHAYLSAPASGSGLASSPLPCQSETSARSRSQVKVKSRAKRANVK
jgi:hypothetical protein